MADSIHRGRNGDINLIEQAEADKRGVLLAVAKSTPISPLPDFQFARKTPGAK
jgi:hypothetical protein